MNLRIPPVVVMCVFGGLMYVLHRFLPVGDFNFFGRKEMSYCFWILGAVIIIISLVQFFLAKTTVDPMQPDKSNELVISGIYNYTRNPMYLGMLLFLIAFGLFLGNAFNTLLAAGFVYYMNHFQIKFEEQALTKKFGQTYRFYLKSVRRWF